MKTQYDLIIRNGTILTPTGRGVGDIAITGGKIQAVGVVESTATAQQTINAANLFVLPGMIDAQVHFREPGLTHKEDFHTGTQGALLGGITTVFEMPNTFPSTTSPEDLANKLTLVAGRAFSNMGFFFGASPENLEHLAEWEKLPGCAGVKAFLGSSTGDLLLDKAGDLTTLLKSGHRRVTLHCEDNARLTERKLKIPVNATAAYHPIWRDEESARLCTERALKNARETGRPIHVLHVSTEEEIGLLKSARDIASFETLPQFLIFDAPEAYERLGSLVQMNPPVRGGRHRAALRRAVSEGIVDVIGSDHAPHTLEEKALPYPLSPSGMTGVQTILPLMLNFVNEGLLSLEMLVKMMSENPARLFGAIGKGRLEVGADADLTLIDMSSRRKIENKWIASRVGWTPYDGMTTQGWPVHAVVGGHWSLRDREIFGSPMGTVARFR